VFITDEYTRTIPGAIGPYEKDNNNNNNNNESPMFTRVTYEF